MCLAWRYCVVDNHTPTDIDRAAYLRTRARKRRSEADIATDTHLRALHLHMASELEGQASGLEGSLAPS